MADGTFFVSWALWEQMSFVLAMSIVAVFCVGLGKLWWTNRLMQKQEILDEEKRARLQEMRKTGIPVKRMNDIPFGIRAIQSGIKVDGIWISRPTSPNIDATAKLASVTTLVGLDSEPQKKGRQPSDDGRSLAASILNPEHTAQDDSVFPRRTESDPLKTTPSTTPPMSQFASRARRNSPRTAPALSEDTLRRLETQARSKAALETYIPTSAPRNSRRPSQRSSGSSSGDSVESQPRSATSGRSASGRSYSSSRSSRMYLARHLYESRLSYNSVPTESPEKEPRDPFETPARTPSGLSAFSIPQTLSEAPAQAPAPVRNHDLAMPEPTFGPGDIHINRATRRVNQGFEVLPAGTFGPLHEFGGNTSDQDNTEEQTQGRISSAAKRLRKKSTGHLPGHASPTF